MEFLPEVEAKPDAASSFDFVTEPIGATLLDLFMFANDGGSSDPLPTCAPVLFAMRDKASAAAPFSVQAQPLAPLLSPSQAPAGFVVGLLEAIAAVNLPGAMAGIGQREQVAVRPSIPLVWQAPTMLSSAPPHVVLQQGATPSPPLPSLAASEEDDWRSLRTSVGVDLVRHNAARGDVQTAVTMARTLGPEVEARLGRRFLQQLLVQYIELLHRLALWSPASTVMARSGDEGVRRINQMSTSVLSACGSCGRDREPAVVPPALVAVVAVVRNKDDDQPPAGAVASAHSVLPPGLSDTATAPEPFPAQSATPAPAVALSSTTVAAASPSTAASAADFTSDSTTVPPGGGPPQPALQAVAAVQCRSCNHVASACAVCLEPVRGIYTTCLGCGHGGHLAHMREYFSSGATLCPAGCMHACTL